MLYVIGKLQRGLKGYAEKIVCFLNREKGTIGMIENRGLWKIVEKLFFHSKQMSIF